MSPFRIYLFGVPRFERDEAPFHIPRRKAIALLAYLATTAQPHSRDALGTMFWPENDQSSARANLRRELSRIKSALGHQPFQIHQEQVGLIRESWWLDVETFQTSLKDAQAKLLNGSAPAQEEDHSRYIGEIMGAVRLYTGEFMAGFNLPNSPQFDEWQFFQRENLRLSLSEALQQLVYWETAQGEYGEAIEYARRWLALDNLSEPAHRQLMQLYAWSGQQGAAVRQFEESVRLLKKEIGVEPEEDTISLYEAIKARRLPPPDIEAMRLTAPWISATGLPAEKVIAQDDGQDGKYLRTSPLDPAVQSTPFIGREKEQAQINRLLAEDPYSRLVSVVGSGGVGKTRLALEAASAVQQVFPDGVYLVPLAAIEASDQILSQIAESLHFRFHESTGQESQLFDYLRQKKTLLIMDNFEHVLPGISLIKELLQTAPDMKILATSRERLNLVDEVVIPLGGMEYPDPVEVASLNADLSSYEAIQLLVQSARRVQPEFELRSQDLEPAGRLCSLVEGVPLAIILAAGWLEMLSLEEIVEEISQSLDFLESQTQDIPERQRSLRAVFDASWLMLDEGERETIERLTIFQGSFTRQAALTVTRTSLTTLLSLIQKAWLQRDQDGRFQIHQLQRQYAFEKLRAKHSAWGQARDGHSTYYALRLEKLAEAMRGPDQDEAYDEIALEFENISIAWNWLVEQDQFDILVQQMLLPLYRYCEARLKSKELLHLVDITLGELESKDEEADHLNELAVLLTVQASFYSKGDPVRLDRYDIIIPLAYEDNIHRVAAMVGTSGDLVRMGSWGILFSYLFGRFVDSNKGQRFLRQLIQNYRQTDQHWELAIALQMLGSLNLVIALNATQKEPVLVEAGQCLTEALGIFERLGDTREYSYTLLWLGGYHSNLNRWDEAISIWTTAQEKFDQLGDSYSSMSWLLGDLLFKIGDYEAAFKYYQEIRDKYLHRGHKRIAAYALSFESLQALRYSDIDHARKTREMSLRLSQEVGDPFGEAWGTWELGEIHRVAGEFDAAHFRFEQARGMFESVNEPNGVIFYHRGLGDIALAKGDQAEAYQQFELSLQHARRVKFIWGRTYALAGLGKAALALGKFEAAHRHLTESLQSAISTRDSGIALFVLAGWAELYAQSGETQQAAEICSLVANHFAAWRETKAQATALLNSLEDLPTQLRVVAQGRGDHKVIWNLADRLLQRNLKPA